MMMVMMRTMVMMVMPGWLYFAIILQTNILGITEKSLEDSCCSKTCLVLSWCSLLKTKNVEVFLYSSKGLKRRRYWGGRYGRKEAWSRVGEIGLVELNSTRSWAPCRSTWPNMGLLHPPLTQDSGQNWVGPLPGYFPFLGEGDKSYLLWRSWWKLPMPTGYHSSHIWHCGSPTHRHWQDGWQFHLSTWHLLLSLVFQIFALILFVASAQFKCSEDDPSIPSSIHTAAISRYFLYQ